MANIMDYMDWRGDLSFEADEFNEVDNLILAQLAYLSAGIHDEIGSVCYGENGRNKTFFECKTTLLCQRDPG